MMTVYGYGYKVSTPGGAVSIDACKDCREKLGLPTSADGRRVRVDEHESSLFRDDPCVGCGASASDGFNTLARPFDGDESISEDFHAMVNATRGADALAQVLNMSEELDVFATVDAETEEVPLATNDAGETLAKVVRQVPDSPKALHLMVMNGSQRKHDREQMEEQCRRLVRLLRLNGWDGAPRPNPANEEDVFPDWEIWAVPLDG